MKTGFVQWDNRIAPVFDTAGQIYILETKSGKIIGELQETLPADFPIQKTLRLVELGVDTLVCGAISRPMYQLLVAYGIRVIPFVTGDLQDVIQAWRTGTLMRDAFLMPGCRHHGGRRFRGGHDYF
ncbi:MAG TPA: NifB/NifX family molybdenum-iron cluster-binding protein [Spirochaetales bacterium]|nr:NifB/NifX family molybdenum-iron cluster-binding protein [Spirochaetales bacterium]